MERLSQTLGFLGAGRMATALAQGCVRSGLVEARQVLAADPSDAAIAQFSQQIPGAQTVSQNRQVVEGADLILLAVKPQVVDRVLNEIGSHVASRHLLVSIAAGIRLNALAARLPAGSRLVRVMPNTPCLVGLGASCYCRGTHATAADAELVAKILTSVGRAMPVEEEQLDAVTGLSGSGPAFVYRMIEALASGGIAMGLPPELAEELSAQTVRGAAEMVLVTGETPAALREQVTSPGGTTLAGLERLEQLGANAAFRAAVEAATLRSRELGSPSSGSS